MMGLTGISDDLAQAKRFETEVHSPPARLHQRDVSRNEKAVRVTEERKT